MLQFLLAPWPYAAAAATAAAEKRSKMPILTPALYKTHIAVSEQLPSCLPGSRCLFSAKTSPPLLSACSLMVTVAPVAAAQHKHSFYADHTELFSVENANINPQCLRPLITSLLHHGS